MIFLIKNYNVMKEIVWGFSKMKKVISLLVIIVLVAIMVGTYIKNQNEADQAINEHALGKEVSLDLSEIGIEKGQFAPDFTLSTLSGETITLSDFKGKKVVLNFWATWCPPCKDEMPHFQKYYEKYAEEDNVEIVAVNLTYARETNERVQQFIDSFGITFPVPLMEDEEIGKPYRIVTIPSTFFIDTEGRIQKNIKGPLDVELLRNFVQELD